MGVVISSNRDENKITFSCDHAGCSKKSVRSVRPHWYDRSTGRTYRSVRRIRKPIAYWAKVLRYPRRRNMTVFFLHGHEDDWPEGVTVFCKEHNSTHRSGEPPTPQKTNRSKPSVQERKRREREWKRYQDRRIDIFD